MRTHSCLAVFCAATLLAAPVHAQEAALTVPEPTPSGAAYLNAISRQPIDSDVVYFDPTATAPELTTQQRLEPVERPERQTWNLSDESWPYGLTAAIILIAILITFTRFGGSFGIMLQPSSDNPHAARRAPRHAARAADIQPRKLAEITSLADRREALVLLAQNALRKAVSANGVLMRQSWTDREALRRLPPDQRHIAALRDLVRASERVQFGGRDVSEEEFSHHLARITPLYRELAS